MNGSAPRQCTSKSKQSGERCKRAPIVGHHVCKFHGGAIPAVRRTAQERLAAMVDPLLTELFRIAQSGDSDAVRLAAIKDALDRAGYTRTDRVDMTTNGNAFTFAIQSANGNSNRD